MPRLLLKVDYNESNYHIGGLSSLIRLKTSIPDQEIRDPSQYRLDITELVSTLKANTSKIMRIGVAVDKRLVFETSGSVVDLKAALGTVGAPIKDILL
jgi:CRISPR-associated protein Csh2